MLYNNDLILGKLMFSSIYNCFHILLL